jgi:hypothetical protein
MNEDRPEENKTMPDKPAGEGWYFAKWRIADDGTRDGDELTPSNEIECVHVVQNSVDPEDGDHLMVMVPGVERWQSLENFCWLGPVPMPAVNSD